MPDIMHLVKIHASPDQVYQAITTAEGVRNWWTRDTALDSKVGGTGEFGFNRHQFVIKVKIDELTPQTHVSIRGGEVIDGPFIESKDAIGGIFIIDAASLDDAAEIARSCPCLDLQNGYMEISRLPRSTPCSRESARRWTRRTQLRCSGVIGRVAPPNCGQCWKVIGLTHLNRSKRVSMPSTPPTTMSPNDVKSERLRALPNQRRRGLMTRQALLRTNR